MKKIFHFQAVPLFIGLGMLSGACGNNMIGKTKCDQDTILSLQSNVTEYTPNDHLVPTFTANIKDSSSQWFFSWDDGLFGAQQGEFSVQDNTVTYIPASCELLGGGNHPITISVQAKKSQANAILSASLILNVRCPAILQNVSLKVLAINDFHGQLSSGKRINDKPAGSAAVVAAYLDSARQGRENRTILVNAGDLIGASPANSALLQDEPTISFFNYFANSHCKTIAPHALAEAESDQQSLKKRFDVLFHPHCNLVGIPGNHELDEGVPELMRLLGGGNHPKGPFLEDPWKGAKFPVVAANLRDSQQELLFRPYVIKVIDGAPIAFVGAVTTDTPKSVMASSIEGLSFEDEADAINKHVQQLKARNIHAIVAVIHRGGEGLEAYEGSTNTNSGLNNSEVSKELIDLVGQLDEEVDVVITAHTHSFTNALLKNSAGKDVLVTQAYRLGTAYADIDLTVDKDSFDIVQKSAKIVPTYAENIAPNEEIAKLTKDSEVRVEPYTTQEICKSNGVIPADSNNSGESALGNLIAEAHQISTGANIGITNRGGIRASLPANCHAKECIVTWNDCFNTQPFANWIMLLEMTGNQLYDLLEQQWKNSNKPNFLQIAGFRYSWTKNATAGKRVVEGSLKLANGDLVEKSKSYKVAVNNYLATGGDGFTVFLEAKVLAESGPNDLDAFVNFLKEKAKSGPIKSESLIDGRIQKL